ncbi:MAG TPA: PIG-L family deacetylase [Roseiflexaceae bacterium]|nr:PIG-L family deacetylase [Roseiflexaceae bacterium]
MAETLKLLAVLPHPDDETLAIGGLLARYSAEGVETHVICATRGEYGWSGPPEQNPGPTALGQIREAELRCAAHHLGLHELTFLDYLDGMVDQAEPQAIMTQIAGHIRRIQPQVVITFPPDGHYGHPDHIALSQFTVGAVLCAADAGFHDPAARAPFRVSKLYYTVDTLALVEAFSELVGTISMEIDGIVRNHVGWEAWAVTTRIDATDYFDRVWQAVMCHQSQLPGYAPVVDLPRDMLLRFFGEGTLYRVFSLVNGGRAVEHDLFQGIRNLPSEAAIPDQEKMQ